MRFESKEGTDQEIIKIKRLSRDLFVNISTGRFMHKTKQMEIDEINDQIKITYVQLKD